MDVPISHVIGTIALIMLTVSVAAYFAISVYHVQTEILKQHLTEVANYVLMNFMETMTLLQFTELLNNATVFKILNLPSDISGHAYVLEINDASGEGAYIHLYLLTRRDVEVSLRVPLETIGTGIKIFTMNDDTMILTSRESVIESLGTIYSSRENIVVWGRKASDIVWVGIGVWRRD